MNAGGVAHQDPGEDPWVDPVAGYDDEPGFTVDELVMASAVGDTTLVVMAIGFDPRCVTALHRIVAITPRAHVLAIDLQRGDAPSDPRLDARRDHHRQVIMEIVASDKLVTLDYPRVHEPASAGRLLARHVADEVRGGEFRHVIVDISATPTTLSFPIVRALLDLAAEGPNLVELQVVVTENPLLDGMIEDVGVEEAHLVAGFSSPLNRARADNELRIWTPLLGEGANAALRAVHTEIAADGVCPIVPFPARNARRADELILEHRALLEDEFLVRPGDYIYAAERNPFDLYRTLVRFAADTQQTLSPVGPAVVAISCHSSKLLSVGALLAAYHSQLPVVAAAPTGYRLADDAYAASAREGDRLACLWIRGAPYQPGALTRSSDASDMVGHDRAQA
jgi:hypothetical protein